MHAWEYYCIDLIHFRSETRLFPGPFLVNTGWFLILEKVFRNDNVAACSTALRSVTEENDSGGHVDVPCSSKLTQHKSTVDWLNFCDVTRSVATERVRNKYSLCC